MEPTAEQNPLTFEAWKMDTAEHARKVADHINEVLTYTVSANPELSFGTVLKKISELEASGIGPDNVEEFNKQIELIRTVKERGVNPVEAVRQFADYLAPPKEEEASS